MWEKGALVLEPKETDYEPEDATEEQIWAQVESDLGVAIAGLPESWPAAETGRVTKGAAVGILAKVLMQQHKWSEAKTQLEWIIGKEGSLYGLVPIWMDNFTHTNENNIESLFEIQYNDTNRGNKNDGANMNTSFTRPRFYGPNSIGWADGKARRWLVDEFKKERRADSALTD